MTPWQDEIHRIIAGFSAKERAIFSKMGGTSPRPHAPEPEWWRPGDPIHSSIPQRHRPTVLMTIDGEGSYSYRQVAEILNVKEASVRGSMKGMECKIRGVKVRRLSPPRSYEKAA